MSSPHRKRASHRSFMGMPWTVIRHRSFGQLTGHGVKLLIELREQYHGYNNGDLDATWTRMQVRGWRSKETLYSAIHELIYYGFITRTRKGKKLGGIHYPSLYALTWEAIDYCGKGFEGTALPSHNWKLERPRWRRPQRNRKERKPSAESVPDEYGKRTGTGTISVLRTRT